jgi:hypothetical protein
MVHLYQSPPVDAHLSPLVQRVPISLGNIAKQRTAVWLRALSGGCSKGRAEHQECQQQCTQIPLKHHYFYTPFLVIKLYNGTSWKATQILIIASFLKELQSHGTALAPHQRELNPTLESCQDRPQALLRIALHMRAW